MKLLNQFDKELVIAEGKEAIAKVLATPPYPSEGGELESLQHRISYLEETLEVLLAHGPVAVLQTVADNYGAELEL